jgi:hypothetical protein
MVEVVELPFHVGARVRLIHDFQGIPKGTEGVIRGFYRSDPPRYAVDFDGPSRQVPPEHLEPAEPEASASGEPLE